MTNVLFPSIQTGRKQLIFEKGEAWEVKNHYFAFYLGNKANLSVSFMQQIFTEHTCARVVFGVHSAFYNSLFRSFLGSA